MIHTQAHPGNPQPGMRWEHAADVRVLPELKPDDWRLEGKDVRPRKLNTTEIHAQRGVAGKGGNADEEEGVSEGEVEVKRKRGRPRVKPVNSPAKEKPAGRGELRLCLTTRLCLGFSC